MMSLFITHHGLNPPKMFYNPPICQHSAVTTQYFIQAYRQMSSTSGGGLDLILSHVSEWNRCEHTQAPMSTSAETFLLYLEQ